jgi:formylglycine-generating enzyme required for sulfatase activity
VDEFTDDTYLGVQDDWVFVDRTGSPDFYIYQYEASRPDSVSDDGGNLDARSCSKPNAIPWTSINRADAAAACTAAGGRLCTQGEWQAACNVGAGGTVWAQTSPATYNAGVCNDVENYGDPDDAVVWPTGSGNACYAQTASGTAGRVYDLSGNVSEWTSSTASSNGNTYYRVRGGNYTSYGPATACDFSFVLAVPSFANADLGFRCCADAIP